MRGLRIERVTWVERGLWAALIGAVVAPLAFRPAPAEVVGRYVEAMGRGDVDGMLDLVGEDVVVFPSLGGGYFGRERARLVLEYRAGLRERWRVLEWRDGSGAGQVGAVIEARNDVGSRLGVRPRTEVLFTVRGSRLAAEFLLDDSRSLRRALRPFLAWAAEHRPRELARVWAHDRPIRSADAARRLVALLDEWRAPGPPVAAPAEPEQR